jgi:hypothetical protein
MISAVIELGERRVHEVMVPRTDMTALPVTTTMDEAIDTFIREGHSRVPVYKKAPSTKSSASCTPRTSCRSSRAAGRSPICASCCARRSSCPSPC